MIWLGAGAGRDCFKLENRALIVKWFSEVDSDAYKQLHPTELAGWRSYAEKPVGAHLPVVFGHQIQRVYDNSNQAMTAASYGAGLPTLIQAYVFAFAFAFLVAIVRHFVFAFGGSFLQGEPAVSLTPDVPMQRSEASTLGGDVQMSEQAQSGRSPRAAAWAQLSGVEAWQTPAQSEARQQRDASEQAAVFIFQMGLVLCRDRAQAAGSQRRSDAEVPKERPGLLDRPLQASTTLQYAPRYQHADGSAAYREKPHQKRDAYIEEGTSYAQVAHKKLAPLPPLTFNACWWIMAWFWEAVDALCRDDSKVPPPPTGKHALSMESFCRKNALKFGQEDRNCLGGLASSHTRVTDVVQLTRDLKKYFEVNAVGDATKSIFGYKGLQVGMLGDLSQFCAPVAQKTAIFLPQAQAFIAPPAAAVP
eukprot:s5368_g4.t1